MARNGPGGAGGDKQRELRKARIRGGWRSRGRLRRASSEQEENQEKMYREARGWEWGRSALEGEVVRKAECYTKVPRYKG